jgi:hypothetical protein
MLEGIAGEIVPVEVIVRCKVKPFANPPAAAAGTVDEAIMKSPLR